MPEKPMTAQKLREVFDRREKPRRLKMYKNAGIQSRKEAVQRLIDGEKFYWEVWSLGSTHHAQILFVLRRVI
jgi:hypothetical protein